MADWQIAENVYLDLGPAASDGTCTATGTASFTTKPLTFFAVVKQFKASFGNADHHVMTVGMGIDSLEPDPPTDNVTVTGWVQLVDHGGTVIDPASSLLVVDVVALCEE